MNSSSGNPTKNISAKELAKYFDHTALKAETTAKDIETLCAEARDLGTASVCVSPVWIPLASRLLKGSHVMPITVVGFPLGANGTAAKVFEASQAIRCGALEIDMVLSIGEIKSKFYAEARQDIVAVKKACGKIPLKVIFETALLTAEEISMVAKWCAEEHVDYVKTSTGFSTRGASLEDLRLMQASIAGSQTKIKASGGIRNLKDTLTMIEAGAHRIGASATRGIIAELTGGTSDQTRGY